MFSDSKFAIAALKEYGAPILMLATLFILKQVGLLNVDSFSSGVNIGTFFSGIGVVLIAIMAYAQTIIKLLKNHDTTNMGHIVDDVQETKFKVNETYTIVNNQINQTQQMQYLMMNIYDVVKGIPNKNLIYENLIVMTRYLLNNGLEIILEYTVSNANPMSSETLLRIQNKLSRQLSRLHVEYVESVSKISKSYLKTDSKLEIDSLLDTFFADLYDTTTSTKLEIEDILFKINSSLKDLEDSLKIIFNNYLNISDSDVRVD